MTVGATGVTHLKGDLTSSIQMIQMIRMCSHRSRAYSGVNRLIRFDAAYGNLTPHGLVKERPIQTFESIAKFESFELEQLQSKSIYEGVGNPKFRSKTIFV